MITFTFLLSGSVNIVVREYVCGRVINDYKQLSVR